jgi:hypothetical protein
MLVSFRSRPPGTAEEKISGRISATKEEDRKARSTVAAAGPMSATGVKREGPPSLRSRPTAEGAGPSCSHQWGRQGPSPAADGAGVQEEKQEGNAACEQKRGFCDVRYG